MSELSRIAARITTAGDVVIPPRIAQWLEKRAGIVPEWRTGLERTDPEAYEVLMALHCVADAVPVSGTKHVVVHGDQSELNAWLTPAEAAPLLNVTDRCIRTWCSTGRLPATWRKNGWRIRRTDIRTYQLTA